DPDLAPGDYVCLEVSDDGPGMTEEVKGKIFDPFFTTKFTGRGLGLAAVQGIVRGHRGAIRVQTEPGKGARVQALFPPAEGAVGGGGGGAGGGGLSPGRGGRWGRGPAPPSRPPRRGAGTGRYSSPMTRRRCGWSPPGCWRRWGSAWCRRATATRRSHCSAPTR